MTGVIKSILIFYTSLFLVLSGWVLFEACHTVHWTQTGQHSVIFALAMSSGWFDKIAVPLNTLFGASGGLLAAKDDAKAPNAGRIFRFASLGLCAAAALTALSGMFVVSLYAGEIADKQTGLHGQTAMIKDAITALGLMNVSLLAGFIAGVGLQKSGIGA